MDSCLALVLFVDPTDQHTHRAHEKWSTNTAESKWKALAQSNQLAQKQVFHLCPTGKTERITFHFSSRKISAPHGLRLTFPLGSLCSNDRWQWHGRPFRSKIYLLLVTFPLCEEDRKKFCVLSLRLLPFVAPCRCTKYSVEKLFFVMEF